MTKDIYDQFKAAEEQLAIQEAEAATVKIERLQEEKEARLRAAEQARLLQERQRQEEESRKARARELVNPIVKPILDVWEAIKTNDPRIKDVLQFGIETKSHFTEDKDHALSEKRTLQLRWGNKIEPTTSDQMFYSNPRLPQPVRKGFLGRVIKDEIAGTPPFLLFEDCNLIQITIDSNDIAFDYSDQVVIQTDQFLRDTEAVLLAFIKAVQKPIDRYLGYTLRQYDNSKEGGYMPIDRSGEAYSGVEHLSSGKLRFFHAYADTSNQGDW